MALTTVSAYKTYAGITGSGSDAVLAVLLSQASAVLRRMTGRDLSNGFESASRTEYYDGKDAETIQLREWPVTSITSVKYVNDDGSTETIGSTEYRVNTLTGVLSMLGSVRGRFIVNATGGLNSPEFGVSPRFDAGFQNVQVVYTGGYSSIPADLELAVFRLMDVGYSQRGRDSSKQSESIGDYSYTMYAAAETDAAISGIVQTFRTGSL